MHKGYVEHALVTHDVIFPFEWYSVTETHHLRMDDRLVTPPALCVALPSYLGHHGHGPPPSAALGIPERAGPVAVLVPLTAAKRSLRATRTSSPSSAGRSGRLRGRVDRLACGRTTGGHAERARVTGLAARRRASHIVMTESEACSAARSLRAAGGGGGRGIPRQQQRRRRRR